jgi:hypothetical protein
MATNLVSTVMQFLTPDMIGKIATALGLSREDAQSGIAAAVPTLLAAISGAAAKPGGAQSLVDTIKQQSGVLDSFAGMIGGGKQPPFIKKGSSLLTSLLGSHDQSALATAIGKSAGLSQDGSRSLLGMLTPVVMGLIGKQIGPRLDVGSLTGLLSSQKQQIAQALPAGMNNLLGGTGLLDSLISATGSATDTAGQMGRAASAATGDAARYASSTVRSAGAAGQRAASSTASSMPSWVYWVVPLAVIAGLAVYFLGDRGTQVAQQAPATVQSVVVGGVDIGKQVGDSLTTLRTSLQGITDVPSATAALPKLQEATAQIDKVNGMLGQLSEDQRKLVSGLVATSMTTIDQLFEKALAIPGVGEVLKPTVDNLRMRMAELSGQNTTVGVKR